MKYLLFIFPYTFFFFVVTFCVYKFNKIDTSDYDSRKEEIKKQTQKMIKNTILAMFTFNLVSALIYKLISLQFLSVNSLVGAVFLTFIESSLITILHPKIAKTDVCVIERVVLSGLTMIVFILSFNYAF